MLLSRIIPHPGSFQIPCYAWRKFSITSSLFGRRNPRSRPISVMDIPDPVQRKFFESLQEYELPMGMATTGERRPGYVDGVTKKFVYVQEMIPELIVPDLTGFQLKPYVSFKAQDTVEPEYSARDLFDATHGVKLKEEFEKGQLDEQVAEIEERARLGLLKKHTYDKEPPRMLDTSRVPVTEKI